MQQVGGAGVTLDTGGGADMLLNRYDLALQKKLEGWTDFVKSLLRANPNAPLAEKLAFLDRANAKFGNLWAELH